VTETGNVSHSPALDKDPPAFSRQAGGFFEDSHAFGITSSASVTDLEALPPENIPFLHLQPRLKERFRHEQHEDGSYLI
jgi:hypothetical protein